MGPQSHSLHMVQGTAQARNNNNNNRNTNTDTDTATNNTTPFSDCNAVFPDKHRELVLGGGDESSTSTAAITDPSSETESNGEDSFWDSVVPVSANTNTNTNSDTNSDTNTPMELQRDPSPDPPAPAPAPARNVKRRAEEAYYTGSIASAATSSSLATHTHTHAHTPMHTPVRHGAASRDMGVAGLEVSDFEQTVPPHPGVLAEEGADGDTTGMDMDAYASPSFANAAVNGTNIASSNSMNATATATNSYFCIGSGAGCLDRSVSQTCLTRELEQLPMNHREHVGQDLYGIAEECIPDADESLLEQLEEAIVSLLEKGDSKLSSSSSPSAAARASGASSSSPSSAGTSMLPITRSNPELQALVPYHAYRLALSLSPSYVRNPAFRLMFLRATEGDVKKAAKRLTRHFKTKLRLFGEDKLVRDIFLDDLDGDDMDALLSGGFQVLPQRDAAGRSVLFGRYTSMRYKTIDNMLRALWYIWMSLLEDPVNQKKGVVALGYEVGRVPLDRFGCDDDGHDHDYHHDYHHHESTTTTASTSSGTTCDNDDDGGEGGDAHDPHRREPLHREPQRDEHQRRSQPREPQQNEQHQQHQHQRGIFELSGALGGSSDLSGGFDRRLAREIVSVPLSVPARPVGYHLCTDSHQWVGMLNMVMVTLCKFIRLRMRIHHGTDLECRYALMTHGMPTETIPVDEHGGISLEDHLAWIEERKILDARKKAAAYAAA